MMPGMVELGEDIFLKPVRIGVPEYAGGLADVVRNPRYSTAMGLLVEGSLATHARPQGGGAGRLGGTGLLAHEGLVPGQFLNVILNNGQRASLATRFGQAVKARVPAARVRRGDCPIPRRITADEQDFYL